MSTGGRDRLVDPEIAGRLAPPDRVFYSEGVMLNAEDFAAEQTYHRTRLARALSYLHGVGTIAGLRVSWDRARPVTDDRPGRDERLRIDPGLAIDGLGRLIEVRETACIALDRWYQSTDPAELNAALNSDEGGIVVDVFLQFEVCERGKTPGFAIGPFDALDGAVPSRLRDAFRAELILRKEDDPPLPDDPWEAIEPGADADDAKAALQEATLSRWREPTDAFHGGGMELGSEHVPGQDGSSVYLARAILPATAPTAAGERPVRLSDDVTVDNSGRRFVYPAPALARWLEL